MRIQVKVRSRGLEFPNKTGALFHEHLDRFTIAQRSASGERILFVQFGRVSGAKRGGDSTLSIGGGGVKKTPFCEYGHQTIVRSTPCGVETGNSGTDHKEPGANPVGHSSFNQRPCGLNLKPPAGGT